MKNITIIASGTRGDVQPVVALGSRLQTYCYRVSILASSRFAPWIEQHGLTAAPASIDVQAVMQSAGGEAWAEQGNDTPLQPVILINYQ